MNNEGLKIGEWYQDLKIEIQDISDDMCEELEDFLISKDIKYTAKVSNQRLIGDGKNDPYDEWKDRQLVEGEN